MLRRWARLFVSLACALAAWVVATPARAAAPLCDDRGATTFAPAPQLQAPEQSIDVGDAGGGEDCLGAAALNALDDGRAPSPAPAPASSEATLPLMPRVPPCPARHLHSTRITERAPPSAARARLDRPPR